MILLFCYKLFVKCFQLSLAHRINTCKVNKKMGRDILFDCLKATLFFHSQNLYSCMVSAWMLLASKMRCQVNIEYWLTMKSAGPRLYLFLPSFSEVVSELYSAVNNWALKSMFKPYFSLWANVIWMGIWTMKGITSCRKKEPRIQAALHILHALGT